MSGDWIEKAMALPFTVNNCVDGVWTAPGGSVTEKISPRDGRPLCQSATGDPRDVEAAVASAKRAVVDGRWSNVSLQRRKDVLHSLAAAIERNSDDLALLESVDVGKPIRDAQIFDVPAAASTIRYNAEAADKSFGKVFAADRSSLSYQLRRPMGVVAGVVGWNFPLVLAAAKIGPALAAGNCVVLKPSELTSFSACRLAELALEVGVPQGVLNVIHGGPEVGTALAHHRDVDLLTFTGSTRTGKKLLVASGESNMKRLVLECGGKSPHIVFDEGFDLEAIADAIIARAFWNQGQVCTASSRLLVQESVKQDLVQILIKKTAELKLGDPLMDQTKLGAVVSLAHKKKILSYVTTAERDGARLAYQSNALPPFEQGFYLPPMIFDNVSSDQKIAQEEIFGPVLSVMSFRDEEDAVRIANSTIYGLSSIVWTRDAGRALRVTHGLKSGWIVVNATTKPSGGPGVGGMSIGGHKESGIGVEGGIEGLEAYTSSTAVQVFG